MAEEEGKSPARGTGSKEGAKPPGGGDGPAEEQWHPTAPSLGPHTVIVRESAEKRLARHEQSHVDAMGKDKRRSVVGQTYGPTRARQATLYGIFLAVVIVLVIGGVLLVGALDKGVGSHIPNSAPWAAPNAPQQSPKPLQ